MDLLKAALFVVMALSLGLMWHERDYVLDAYRQDDDGPPELRLSGVTLDFEKTVLTASPYVVHTAPDTRRLPMSVLFTASDVDPVDMIGGEAHIGGFVRVDGGPAAGAVVRLERHTSAGIGVRDVIVGGDGRFAARGLPGGRYRLRAWIPGVATMTTSDVFWLEADGSVSRSYSLEVVDTEPRAEFVNGGAMTVGLTGSFGVVISRSDVDSDGLISHLPVAGVPVAAEFSADVSLLSAPIVATDDRGLAQFRMRCEKPGTGRATVTIEEEVQSVALAVCVPAPTTTLPPVDGGAGGAGDANTPGPTTTVPQPGGDPPGNGGSRGGGGGGNG